MVEAGVDFKASLPKVDAPKKGNGKVTLKSLANTMKDLVKQKEKPPAVPLDCIISLYSGKWTPVGYVNYDPKDEMEIVSTHSMVILVVLRGIYKERLSRKVPIERFSSVSQSEGLWEVVNKLGKVIVEKRIVERFIPEFERQMKVYRALEKSFIASEEQYELDEKKKREESKKIAAPKMTPAFDSMRAQEGTIAEMYPAISVEQLNEEHQAVQFHALVITRLQVLQLLL